MNLAFKHFVKFVRFFLLQQFTFSLHSFLQTENGIIKQSFCLFYNAPTAFLYSESNIFERLKMSIIQRFPKFEILGILLFDDSRSSELEFQQLTNSLRGETVQKYFYFCGFQKTVLKTEPKFEINGKTKTFEQSDLSSFVSICEYIRQPHQHQINLRLLNSVSLFCQQSLNQMPSTKSLIVLLTVAAFCQAELASFTSFTPIATPVPLLEPNPAFIPYVQWKCQSDNLNLTTGWITAIFVTHYQLSFRHQLYVAPCTKKDRLYKVNDVVTAKGYYDRDQDKFYASTINFLYAHDPTRRA